MFSLDNGWLAKLGSTIASLMFLWTVVRQHFPHHLEGFLSKRMNRLASLFYPYIRVTFSEHSSDDGRLKRNDAYAAVKSYLSCTCSSDARRLRADIGYGSDKLDLTMDDNEEVTDIFRGVKLTWTSSSSSIKAPSFSFYPSPEVKRKFSLCYHRRHRDIVQGEYLQHVMDQGKAHRIKKRMRKLYTNGCKDSYSSFRKGNWSHVPFQHPATFDTIAMETKKKEEIMEDLRAFSCAKDYYARIGRAWKRGYLLYGPPGTGKSSMVAAMANFLDYDVYDLELTAVKDNTALRKLMIDTTSKSIIIIEDIDCSLDLTGKRKKKKEKEEEGDPLKPKMPEEGQNESKVTLSGLLNFIDGLWSSCGGERVIVFTTNHVEKLDAALVRRGRMDKHIEMTYCSFGAFKVLARNYLGVENHHLFPKVEELLGEVQITPADVAECLMSNRRRKMVSEMDDDQAVDCLEELLATMEEMKTNKKGGGGDDVAVVDDQEGEAATESVEAN